jgi:hypothetical protein
MMPRKRRPVPWTAREIEACLELYGTMPAERLARVLVARRLSPYRRSPASIRQVVSVNRGAADRLLDVIRDYAGMPLSYLDLEDELGMTRKRVQALALPLVRAGRLERLEGERGEVLLRDPIAWREAHP